MFYQYRIIAQDNLIDFADWSALIDTLTYLEAMPDKYEINPYTNQKVCIFGEGNAYYIEDDELSGEVFYQSGELLVNKVPKSVCESLAKYLNARVEVDNRAQQALDKILQH